MNETCCPRRSVLYVPASNHKALAKISSLACDAVIIDLEDAVAPADKLSARERLTDVFANRPDRCREMCVSTRFPANGAPTIC
jgi:citrate lyase subunit beta/citryl-CoA lyase